MQQRSVGPGANFTGSEFRVQSTRGGALRLKEVNLSFAGVEAKTYEILKKDGNNVLVEVWRSVDPETNEPSTTTLQTVLLAGTEYEVIIANGQQIQIVTSGVTDGAICTLYFEEL